MAFPVVTGTNTSATSTAGTSLVVSLPASLSNGDLLIVFVSQQTGAAATFSASGWVERNNTGNTSSTLAFLTKTSDGTEGASVTVTSTQSGKAAHCSYKIAGATNVWVIGGQTYHVASNSAGGNTTADPPLCPATGGTSDDYLWIAYEGNGFNSLATVFPTSYTDNQLNLLSGGSGGASTKAGVTVCSRNLTASSENPSAFTMDSSNAFKMGTIGVQPAIVVPPNPYRPRYPSILAQ